MSAFRNLTTWFTARAMSPKNTLGDALAGIAVAGLLIPESMGYANIAGLPAQSGLYATAIGLFVYAFSGSSKHLVVSPTSSSAATLAAATLALTVSRPENYTTLAMAIVLVCGAMLLVAGFLRLGFLSEFISKPVLNGFVFGIAVSITIKQIPKLMGIESPHGNALWLLLHVLTELPAANPWASAVGIAALLILTGLKRFAPRIPGAIIVLTMGIMVYRYLNLAQHGVAIVGTIPAGLPQPRFFLVAWNEWAAVLPAALGMALVVYAESIGSARTFAAKHGYAIDSSQELKALGLANLGSAFFQSMPVGGGTSGSAASESAGARSQVSSVCASLMVLITLIWLTPLFHDLPEPVLAAIVIHAVAHLANIGELRRYAMLKTGELPPALTALTAVPLFGILPGLLLSMGLTLVVLLRDLINSHVVELGRIPGTRDFVDCSRHPEAERTPGLILVRLDKPLFFASANRVHSELGKLLPGDTSTHVTKAFVISMELAPSLDVTSIDMLREFRNEAAHRGLTLSFARLKDEVLDVFERSGFKAELGDGRIFWSVDDAVAKFSKDSSTLQPETENAPLS
ncbi:SulP family inorganic anion transporter [Rugosibacter aromaticivorans]|uniref:SulP family inorganic anion transporter n=1 Tax=Rugosibacter aromaticivorans TaxID=1565605 RepID=UPI000A828313|nr:SulP family inorganic anion transporter [Rugosibacter aromaticivorans]TBR12805.1 MAG: SulP family inorganic anion transporter [Rugosibacter sp.]